jgi:hypothetical protein
MADQQLNITLNAIDNTQKALNDLKNNLKGIDKQVQSTGISFFNFKTLLIGLVTSQTLKSIVDATKTFQDLRSNLISATGSIEDGTSAFRYLLQFSKQTQFGVEDLTRAFLTLYQNGVEPTERILKTFTTVAGDASNKVDTLNDLINLFSKATQGGGAGAQALSQLVKNGLPVYDILYQKLGVSKNGIDKLLESAGTSKVVLDALLIGLEERAKNSASRVDNLSTRMDLFGKTLQEVLAGFGDTKAFNYFFDSLSSGFEKNKPLLEFLGSILVGIINLVTFILNTANKIVFEFFDILASYAEPIKRVADNIIKFFRPAVDYLSKGIDKATESWKKFKKEVSYESITRPMNDTFGSSTAQEISGLPKSKPKPEELNYLQKAVQASRLELDVMLDGFNKISEVIARGLVAGIKDVSKAIAESIVLGKSLQTSFADIARNLLVKIIAGLIEEQLAKLALLALDEIGVLLGLKKLAVIKEQNKALKEQNQLEGKGTNVSNEELAKKQLGSIFDELFNRLKTSFDDIFGSISDIFGSISDYSSEIFNSIGSSLGDILGSLGSSVGDIFNSIGGSLGDILGSVGNIFGGGGGGGGGGFDLGTIAQIAGFFLAEGGDVSAGQPYMVGERGRELFIPNQSGTMIPNHDLGTTGATSINFTINATDVKGVQELLINNRATITNLVNQALNARGKSNLV